jgi:DNA repair protein RadC
MNRVIWSRSSEKEGNKMQAKSSLPKKGRLENIDIVRVMLIKDSDSPYKTQRVTKPADVVNVAKNFLAGQDREVFITINIDNFNHINSIHVVSVGTLDTTIIHQREVFKSAILSNAKSIILAHNHPSGNSNPSDNDKQITCTLFGCGDVLGIKVLDHIIIGDGEYSHCMKFNGKDKKEIHWLTDKIIDEQGEAS